jgi:transcriptional regulator with XRE-family HTH domain
MQESTPEIIQAENLIVLEDSHADLHDEKLILDKNTIILAAGDTYSLIDMPALKRCVKQSGLSYEDISEKMDISISAIYKFFSKKSKSPSFYNVLMIFKAIGASVDEICGLHPKRNAPSPDECRSKLASLEKTVSSLQKNIEEQNKLISSLTETLRQYSPASRDDY